MNQGKGVKNATNQQQLDVIRFTGTNLRFRIAESVIQSSLPQQDCDQSEIISKQQIIYGDKNPSKLVKQQQAQQQQQILLQAKYFIQSLLEIDVKQQNAHDDESYCKQFEFKSPNKNIQGHQCLQQNIMGLQLQSECKQKKGEQKNYQSLIPQQYTVYKVEKVNQNEYESTKTNGVQIKQIYYRPTQIQLPPPKIQYNQIADQQAFVTIPCTFSKPENLQQTQLVRPTIISKQSVDLNGGNMSSQNAKQQASPPKLLKVETKDEKQQTNKLITDVLLQKINQLESKVKQLEEQKKKTEQLMKQSDAKSLYNSIPNSLPAFGSIRKNDLNKQFNTINETRQTNLINHQFRVRSVINKSLSGSQFKINSNIYNMTVSQYGNDKHIKDQIKMLKQKLQALESTHIFNDPNIKNSIKQNNNKLLMNQYDDRACSPSRSQLKGKIVKLYGTNQSQSPDNSMRSNILENIQTDLDKGFIRSGPNDIRIAAANRSKQMNSSQLQSQQNRKKDESSAIFRKNIGPALAQRQKRNQYTLSKNGNTLQFNSQKQKIFFTQSRDLQSMIFPKSQSMSPILSTKITDIYIPDLVPYPTPDSTSQELVQIGKLTFKKLGCQVNQNTILNVKKYKNCVHFSIGFQQHILWHFQGKFYYGGWQTHANGEGQKLGIGIQFAPGKYRYKGDFKDGKRSGYGTMIHQNGSIYVGQWLDGVKHGKGRFIQGDGVQYDGEWKNGKKHGSGKILKDGVVDFQGKFQDGLKNGFGKQNFENEDFYEGNYKDNKFQGKGTYFWKSGATYVGQFKDGKRHGHGIWKSGREDYDIYQGEYADDNKHGNGVYKWSNGTVYKGSFKDDLKHGQGCITYQNGKVSYMVWDKGNAEKSMINSQKFQSQHKKNNSASSQYKSRKGLMARSAANLHSAKSSSNLQKERGMPKGLSLKRENQSQIKVQYRSKAKSKDFIKIKMGSESINNRNMDKRQVLDQTPKDPPYKTLQTTSNMRMNI